jgi:3-octaprenyl-4-hydroxybenzoate carboxy-lyase
VPNCAVEVLVHARRHGLVVLISNVFAYHLRVQKAVTANAAVPLVAGENVRSPLGAFRVVFGIRHFNKACMGCCCPARVGSRLVAWLLDRASVSAWLARSLLRLCVLREGTWAHPVLPCPPMTTPRHTGRRRNERSDLRAAYATYVALKQRMPIAFFIGSHPADSIAAVSMLSVADEHEIMGALRNSPGPIKDRARRGSVCSS